ncbi:MAG TPA: hypothetical protein GX497_03410 [Bacillus bacterium]|nr:hypothetical protein [Bacillus sp. (in: firmicutes)]
MPILGAAIDFSGVTMPFSANDLLNSSMGLIGLVAAFVLLGIAIGFAPRIVNFIKGAILGRKSA